MTPPGCEPVLGSLGRRGHSVVEAHRYVGYRECEALARMQPGAHRDAGSARRAAPLVSL